MKNEVYLSEKIAIAQMIGIAIQAVREFPPEIFKEKDVERFIDTYSEMKDSILNPQPQFDNSRSLKQTKHDMLIFFREDTGKRSKSFGKGQGRQLAD